MYSLNQVLIGVPHIDTPELAPSTSPIDHFTTFENLETSSVKLIKNGIDGLIGQEAQVRTTGLHSSGLGLELFACQVQVYFLLAEE